MKRRLLFLFLLFSSILYGQNNIYRSGGITQTIGAPTFVPGASGNVVAIDTITGEWYVNPNRLSGSSWISAGYRLTNISGSVPPAYTPTAHQSHFVVNAANQLYYWDGSAWQTVGGGGGGNGDATRLKFVVVNKSGGTLNKGEVVYVSGAQGNRVAVKKALASTDSLSANTLGVMDETVLNNNEGYCVAEGLVSGINTSAFTEGAALYLSPTTAGAITQTKTTAPDHLVLIGYCVKSSAGSGEISVHIQNGYELGELHDVYVPSPANGQVLTYNTTNTRWEAATVADQSATNEIQTIDTFSLSGQTLTASLLNDGVAASSVTLPIVDVVAGTNVTVTKSNGIATVSATGGGGGGTPAGSAGEVQFNSTPAGSFAASSNLAWDNSNVRLNIGAPSSPTGRLNVKGSGSTSATSALILTNNSNVERFRFRDDGSMLLSNGSIIVDQGANNNSTKIAASQSQPSNFAALIFYPSSSASSNIGQSFNVIPKGSGYSATIKAQFAIFNTDFLSDAVNYEFMVTRGAGTEFRLATGASGTGVVRPILLSSGAASGSNTSQMFLNTNGTVSLNKTSTNYQLDVTAASTFDGLRVVGSGNSSGRVAFQVQSSTATLYNIDNNGKVSYLANAISGTTGNQTINTPSGNVNFAAGATSLTVTNSLCTSSSLVFATVRTNDATAKIKNVVPTAGSFTINLEAGATGVTSVGFLIIN